MLDTLLFVVGGGLTLLVLALALVLLLTNNLRWDVDTRSRTTVIWFGGFFLMALVLIPWLGQLLLEIWPFFVIVPVGAAGAYLVLNLVFRSRSLD